MFDDGLTVSAINELTESVNMLGAYVTAQEKEVVPRVRRLAQLVGVGIDESGALDLLDVLDAAIVRVYMCNVSWEDKQHARGSIRLK